MSQQTELFSLVRHPLKVRMLEVTRVRTLTPQMKRITLGGPELAGFTSLAPEDHVKLFFPRPGEQQPVVPALGPLGLLPPAVGPAPIARDYTPRRYRADTQELELDFFLHGRGVAATWAAQAEPGQRIGCAGPRGSKLLQRKLAWQLFVGDETALPEFSRRLEELPENTRAFAVLLVNGHDEQHALESRGTSVVRWVHRSAPDADGTPLLLAALSGLALPDGEGLAWLAGEASEVRRVYQHLLRERGLPKSHVHASGHWKRGVANHDHHEPIATEER